MSIQLCYIHFRQYNDIELLKMAKESIKLVNLRYETRQELNITTYKKVCA